MNISLFVKRIDTDGDENRKTFEAGEVDKALSLISTIISNEGKTASNLYNLGLCYDAIGESRIILQFYKDALELDKK